MKIDLNPQETKAIVDTSEYLTDLLHKSNHDADSIQLLQSTIIGISSIMKKLDKARETDSEKRVNKLAAKLAKQRLIK